MKTALPVAALLLLFATADTNAARCPQGHIWRMSQARCQTVAAAHRDGLRPVYVRRQPTRVRPVTPRYQVTFENHVWNWVEANRVELIREYGR